MWRGGSGRRNGAAHMTPRGYRGLLQSLRLAVEKAACCVLREHYDDEMNWSTTHAECVMAWPQKVKRTRLGWAWTPAIRETVRGVSIRSI